MIAASAAAQVRHTLSAQVEDLARLRARGNLQLLVAVEGRHIHIRAEGGLGHVDVEVEQDVVLAALEELMRLDVQHEEQAAAWAAIDAGSALPCQADLRTHVHARGNLHLLLDGLTLQPRAAAGVTRRRDGLTTPITGGTGGRLHHLAEEGLTDLAHLALSVTGGAFDGTGARFRARAVTGRAGFLTLELDLLLDAEDGLLERQRDLHLQVASAPWTVARAPSAARGKAELSKQFLEDIAKVGGVIVEATAAHVAEAFLAEAVVACTFVLIGQHAVGLVDLLELLLGVRLFVHIGMILTRQFTERRFDLVVRCALAHTQDFVIIAIAHNFPMSLRGR